MSIRFLLILIATYLCAFNAKVEPYDKIEIRSSVSGKIIEANKELESRNLDHQIVVLIDDYQDRMNLDALFKKQKLFLDQINNLKKVVKIKNRIYLSYKESSTKSQLEKDLKFFDYINSINQLKSLEAQLADINSNIKKIEDIIKKKVIFVDGYLYKLYVNKEDFVTVNRLIAVVYNLSKQKLVLFVPIENSDILNKKVYINNKLSNFKVSKFFKVVDDKFVTSYRVELVGYDKSLKFGQIVKVEFR